MAVEIQFAPIGQQKAGPQRTKLISNGCLLCIKRRVKCDEGKPGCQRCEKIGSRCPGYRSSSALVFRDMNKSAEKKALGPKARPKPSPTQSSASNSSSNSSSGRSSSSGSRSPTTSDSDQSSLSLIPRISNDIEHQSICYFVENYMIPSDGGKPGYLDFVPELYAKSDSAPYFKDTLIAVGMSALANSRNMPHLTTQARGYFGNALSGMRTALSSTATAKSDHLLAASFLATKYEMISGEAQALFESHGAGQLALVKLRGPAQMQTAVGRSLFFMVSSRARMRSAMEGTPPQLPQLPGPGAGAQPMAQAKNPFVKMAELTGSSLELLAKARQSLILPNFVASEIPDLIFKLAKIDNELKGWYDNVFEVLCIRKIPNEPSIYARGVDAGPFLDFLPIAFIFKEFMHTGFWSLFAFGRIQILRMLDSCIAHCNIHGLPFEFPGTDSQYLSPAALVQSRLQHAVDKIFATSPYMLGKLDKTLCLTPPPSTGSSPSSSRSDSPESLASDSPTTGFGKALGAYGLMWLLYVAGQVTCISDEQHDFIHDRLLDIGREQGIKQALALRYHLKSLRETQMDFANARI